MIEKYCKLECSMSTNLEKLETLASELAALDKNIIEIFVHTNKPVDPLKKYDEVYLICLLDDFKSGNFILFIQAEKN